VNTSTALFVVYYCVLFVHVGTETSSPFNMFRVYSLDELEKECGGNLRTNIKLTNPTITDMNLVNGQFQPTLELTAGSPTLLSFINAFGGNPLDLSLSNRAACELNVISSDGVYHSALWPRSVVHIPAAARNIVEVYCSGPGTFYIHKYFEDEHSTRYIYNICVTYHIYSIYSHVIYPLFITILVQSS
jgi:FtsP/CotA-like multicopper oxidase with cupredoxin domain